MLPARKLLPMLALFGTGGGWAAAPPPSLVLPEAVDWQHAIPAGTARTALLYCDHPPATHLRGFLHADLKPPITTGPFTTSAPLRFIPQPVALRSLRDAVDAFPENANAAAELEIQWLGDAPTYQQTRLFPVSGRIVSTYRSGITTLTRTLLVDAPGGAIFLHFIADQPGALSFRASLRGPGPATTLENRRELTRSHGDHEARAWILPFEADVEPDGSSILLRGEGEALIILNFGPKSAPHPPAETLKRLAAAHDPGHAHPDPTKIWQAILAAHPDWPATPPQDR